MTWYAFLAPVVLISLIVRVDAKLIGPYWSWLEMLRDLGYDDNQGRRRVSLLRRVAIPGVAGFTALGVWPATYDLVDAMIIGFASAALLLWPLLFSYPPWGVSANRLLVIYGLLLVSFAASCSLGGYIAQFARADDGIGHFLQENIFGILIGAVVTTFGTSALVRASSAASQRRSQDAEL